MAITKVEQLERDIMALSRSDFVALRDWFQSHLADEWDEQIEADLQAGKLDRLTREALSDHQAGKSKPL